MSRHTVEFSFADLDFRAQATYSPATPDVMYLPNGDPGYPGDPEEIEITELELMTDAGPLRLGHLIEADPELGELLWEQAEAALQDLLAEPPDEPPETAEYYRDEGEY